MQPSGERVVNGLLPGDGLDIAPSSDVSTTVIALSDGLVGVVFGKGKHRSSAVLAFERDLDPTV